MRLETTRFDTIEVDSNTIITFTQPIIGFQEYRRFVTRPVDAEPSLTWLQSTDSGDLAFLLMDPKQAMSDYAVELGQHELTELSVSSVDELSIYTLLVIPEDGVKVRTNLRAPILINSKQRLAMQIVLERSNYPIQCFLQQADSDARGLREVSNARSDA